MNPETKPDPAELLKQQAENPTEEKLVELSAEGMSYTEVINLIHRDKDMSVEEKLRLVSDASDRVEAEYTTVKERNAADKAALRETSQKLGIEYKPSEQMKENAARIEQLGDIGDSLHRIKTRLRKEVDELPIAKPEERIAANPDSKMEMGDSGKVADSLMRISGVLRQRDGDMLTPFMESGDIGRFMSAAQQFQEGGRSGSMKEIVEGARSLSSCLEQFGKIGSPNEVRESLDSLRALRSAFDGAARDIQDFARTLQGADVEAVVSSLFRSVEKIDLITKFLDRKAEILDRVGRW